MGSAFDLHVKSLPGAPDLVFPKYKIVAFVHGCFWHGHNCPRGQKPSSNRRFWNRKLAANKTRDRASIKILEKAGWTVLVIWTCEMETGIEHLLAVLDAARDQLELPQNSKGTMRRKRRA
jgi:DNA mismatch endonuclease (patch repair protein)